MMVVVPILNIPLPVVAGALVGSVGPFQILHIVRRLIRKLDLMNKGMETGIRSKRKIKNLIAYVKALRNTYIVKKNPASSSQTQAISLRIPLTRCHLTSNHFSRLNQLDEQKDSKQFSGSITTPMLEAVFKSCSVRLELKFENAIPFWKQRSARKIAEGSYGEIYMSRNIDGTKRVFKCVAVNGQHLMNSFPNIELETAVPDIVSSKCLSDLNEGSIFAAPNFPIVYNICLVRDRFPELLMKAWWDYKNSSERLKDPAEHPRPDQNSESQLYLIIESSFCGEELTRKQLQNAWMGVSILSQIISALAVAEAACNFEHRDLHLGNILVQSTSTVSLKYTIHNRHFSIETVGCHVFIIDFSLSRIDNGECSYCVGLDEIVQSTSGPKDPNESIWMNHKNLYKVMAENSKGSWNQYIPLTNIIWLKYLNEMILDYVQKNNPQLTKLVSPPNEHSQMTAFRLLKKWNDCILYHESATDLLENIVLKDNPIVSVYDSYPCNVL